MSSSGAERSSPSSAPPSSASSLPLPRAPRPGDVMSARELANARANAEAPVNLDIFDERRPVKTFREGVRDNPLVVAGIVLMFGIMFRGIWHAIHGRELISNQLARYRSLVGIATLGIFGVSAYQRELEWQEELQRRREARKEYFARIEAEEAAAEAQDARTKEL